MSVVGCPLSDFLRLTTDGWQQTTDLMYQRPRFLEELHAIREEMSRECDYDVDLFAEMVRSNQMPTHGRARNIRGVRQYAPPNPALLNTPSTKPASSRGKKHDR